MTKIYKVGPTTKMPFHYIRCCTWVYIHPVHTPSSHDPRPFGLWRLCYFWQHNDLCYVVQGIGLLR